MGDQAPPPCACNRIHVSHTQVRWYLEALLSQGRISDRQVDYGFCTTLLPQRTKPETHPDLSVAALALVLAARRRVPDLARVFLAARRALLQQAERGKDVARFH